MSIVSPKMILKLGSGAAQLGRDADACPFTEKQATSRKLWLDGHAQATSMMPPKEMRTFRYHWVRDRSRLECWEWQGSLWWMPGSDASRAPDEAAEWGWTYVGPAIPPAT